MRENLKNAVINSVIVVFSAIILSFLLLSKIKLAHAENFEIFQDKNMIYINNNNRFESNYSIIFDNIETEKIRINLKPYKSKNLEIPKNIEKIVIIKKTNSILSQGAEIDIQKQKNNKMENAITGNAVSEKLKSTSFNFAILIVCLAAISFIIFRILQNERKEL